MSREITSHKVTEKFSFIYSLTISQERKEEATISVKDTQSTSTMEIEDWMRELKNSSALVKRPLKSNSGSLAVSKPATISNQWYEIGLDSQISELDLLSIAGDTNYDFTSSRKNSNRYLDKIFFTAALGYLIFFLCWLFSYENGKFLPIFPSISDDQTTISQSDREFLDYMERSLELIDRKLLAQQEKSNISSANQDSAKIVYVPVYTPNSQNQVQNSTPVPLPPPPPPMTPFNAPVAKITSPPPPLPQVEESVNTPRTSESTETVLTPPPVEVTATVKPTKNYMLVGLMELGTSPTAMFRGKGGTKRVGIGQTIDDSGWKLEAVKERNVIISRQGESRTINIGEKF